VTNAVLPTLPANDPEPRARESELSKSRSKHTWDHDYLPPLALLDEPGTQLPHHLDAIFGVFKKMIPRSDAPDVHYVAERFCAQAKIGQNQHYIGEVSKKPAFESVEEFKQLFVTLETPLSLENWPQDAFFSMQRVAGMNPVVLRRAYEPPRKLAVDDARVGALLPRGLTLADAAKTGRLYACDYGLLDGIPLAEYQGRPLFTAAPVALFWVDDKGELQPLAIQLGQEPAPGAVVTPLDDPKVWLIAKTYLQIADMNLHEMGTHLCRTHFLIEGFQVAAARQLSSRHPVKVLLQPHLRILIFNNFEGRELLIGPKGVASQIMAGGNDGSIEIVRRAYEGYGPRGIAPWTFESWDLPKELAERGVDDRSLLPDYPYRDDGLLVWEALQRYVLDYLQVYYSSDGEVAQDVEVQAWVADLQSAEGGRVPRIAPPQTIAELATILTRILFTCGPQHSAINFSQYDFASFAPNMSAAAYARPPQDLRSWRGDDLDALLLRMLPPPGQAVSQLKLIAELCVYRYDRLGYYEPNDFVDPLTRRPISVFHKSLEQAGMTIATRNRNRAFPYPYMRPDLITNSTSI
jgi:arachidonate 15-lipoxygenase